MCFVIAMRFVIVSLRRPLSSAGCSPRSRWYDTEVPPVCHRNGKEGARLSARRFLVLAAALLMLLPPGTTLAEEPAAALSAPARVVVIPVRAQIAPPELFILRRGLKQAIEDKVDTVILDMETPGGALGITFDILKALERFPGKTVTYVNSEAISAGALIAAGTDEIHFAPGAVIGAAAPVMVGGQEIEESMRQKIVSYLKARVRAISEGKSYRGDVISAMIDEDFELKIGEKIIKPKGELLSLTATEAVALHGDPPRPLLGTGIAADLDTLVTQLHGPGPHQITRLEITWSERVAQYLTAVTPVLLALGMLALFIEFKTPGFGIFGVAGLVLLGVVFFGHHVAGLSGHEPMLFFLLGLVLVALEVFVIPGTLVPAVAGGALMLGSLVYAMLDLWPNEPLNVSGGELVRPLVNVLGGVSLAILLFLLLLKWLPKGGPWGGMVLETAVGGTPVSPQPLDPAPHPTDAASLIGRTAVAATTLFPSGQVEIDGRRYEARLELGSAAPGARLKVVGTSPFGLLVEALS